MPCRRFRLYAYLFSGPFAFLIFGAFDAAEPDDDETVSTFSEAFPFPSSPMELTARLFVAPFWLLPEFEATLVRSSMLPFLEEAGPISAVIS